MSPRRSRNLVAVFSAFALAAVSCSSAEDTATMGSENPGTTASAPTSTTVVAPPATPGEFTVAVSFGGRDRRYLLHVPETVVEPVVVVMSLHGGGGNAQQHKDDIGLDTLADGEGFVALYPDGTGIANFNTWNAGSHCCGRSVANGIDDVGFLDAVLADLNTRLVYDRSRVVVAGHSNGAMMAARFAAESSLPVGAVVSVAGVEAPDVVPNVAVPRLHIHSVDDPRALYEGGVGPPFPITNTTVTHFAVEPVLDAWAEANGCDPVPTEAAAIAADGHSVTDVVWTGCAADMILKRLTGAGHGWPGVETPLVGLLGPSTEIVDATAEIWAFAQSQL